MSGVLTRAECRALRMTAETEAARFNLDLTSRFCFNRHYEGAAFRDRNNPMLKNVFDLFYKVDYTLHVGVPYARGKPRAQDDVLNGECTLLF